MANDKLSAILSDPDFHRLSLADQADVMRSAGATDEMLSDWVQMNAKGPVMSPQTGPERPLAAAQQAELAQADKDRATRLRGTGWSEGYPDATDLKQAGKAIGLAAAPSVAAAALEVPAVTSVLDAAARYGGRVLRYGGRVLKGAAKGALASEALGGATDVGSGVYHGQNPAEIVDTFAGRFLPRAATGAALGGAFSGIPVGWQEFIKKSSPDSVRKILDFLGKPVDKVAAVVKKWGRIPEPVGPPPSTGTIFAATRTGTAAAGATPAVAVPSGPPGIKPGQSLAQYFNKAGGSKAQRAFLDATGATLKGREGVEAKVRDAFMQKATAPIEDLSTLTDDQLAQLLLQFGLK